MFGFGKNRTVKSKATLAGKPVRVVSTVTKGKGGKTGSVKIVKNHSAKANGKK